jgi:hypothetical protein
MCLGTPIFYTRKGGLKKHVKIIFSCLGVPTHHDYDDMGVKPLRNPPQDLEPFTIEERLEQCDISRKNHLISLLER